MTAFHTNCKAETTKRKMFVLVVKMNIYLIIFTFIIPTIVSARTFRINNQCNQKLWFGIQGQPLIYSGGFDVDAGSTKEISVPDGWVKEYALRHFLIWTRSYFSKHYIVGQWTYLATNKLSKRRW
jgi:hypothetical protein